MTITNFIVETNHPAGAPWAGQHKFTVAKNHDGSFCAKSSDFGCGRDAENELAAIYSLAAASGCVVENLCIDH